MLLCDRSGPDAKAVRRSVEQVVAVLERLGVLVTAAGITHRDGLQETTEAVWCRVVDIVRTGTFHAIQSAVPVRRAPGYGKIATIPSISGAVTG